RVSSDSSCTHASSTLSLHDALPISTCRHAFLAAAQEQEDGMEEVAGVPLLRLLAGVRVEVEQHRAGVAGGGGAPDAGEARSELRSEEHTSELQSRENLVCRLLLEKK